MKLKMLTLPGLAMIAPQLQLLSDYGEGKKQQHPFVKLQPLHGPLLAPGTTDYYGELKKTATC